MRRPDRPASQHYNEGRLTHALSWLSQILHHLMDVTASWHDPNAET
jgi:hypothetical protein